MIADTNLLLRVIDGPEHPLHERATRMLRDALSQGQGIRVLPTTLHEIAYVLCSKAAGYGFAPSVASETINDLLDAPELAFEDAATLRLATELFGATGIDFHDCYLAAVERTTDEHVLSLDDDITKLRQRC